MRTVAFDMDEVLARLIPLIAWWHNRKFGTHLTLAHFTTYNWWEIWGGTREEGAEKVVACLRETHPRQLHPIRGACRTLRLLLDYYRLIIITSRDPRVEQETRAWLETHMPGIFSEVFFVHQLMPGGSPTAKADICLAQGATYLVDDHRPHLYPCVERGILPVEFGEYLYQQEHPAVPGVLPAKTWAAVRKILLPRAT